VQHSSTTGFGQQLFAGRGGYRDVMEMPRTLEHVPSMQYGLVFGQHTWLRLMVEATQEHSRRSSPELVELACKRHAQDLLK
jgi:hypothetical protein